MSQRFQDYVADVQTRIVESKGALRVGQAYMNVLCDYDKDLYAVIVNDHHHLDPHDADERLEAFLEFVGNHLVTE